MKKIFKSKKTIPLTVTITEELLKQLDEILEANGSFLSRSDVVRAAIKEFHRSERPAYIYDRSATDKMKREKHEKEKSFTEMTDQDFADSIKGAWQIMNPFKVKMLFILGRIKGTYWGFPVEGLKVASEADPWFTSNIDYHYERFEKGETVKQEIRDFPRAFLDDYKIPLENLDK